MQHKITVIGAGNVGATAAQRVTEREWADVVLIDILEGVPFGKALDLAEAAPIENHDAGLTGANDYEATRDSEVVIITSGIPRKPGMSRDDLLATNARIMKTEVSQAVRYSPQEEDTPLCRLPDR